MVVLAATLLEYTMGIQIVSVRLKWIKGKLWESLCQGDKNGFQVGVCKNTSHT